MDDTAAEGGALIGIKAMVGQLVACHPADCVDEILTVQVLKLILIGIMCIQLMVKLMSGRVFDPILIMSVLGRH